LAEKWRYAIWCCLPPRDPSTIEMWTRFLEIDISAPSKDCRRRKMTYPQGTV
jgi:hypothetical protein